MTQAMIGYPGTAVAGTAGVGAYAPLNGLIKEMSPGMFERQVVLSSAILANGILDVVEAKGEEFTFTAKVGPKGSRTTILDNDLLPVGESSQPVKGRARPVAMIETLELGRLAAEAKMTEGAAATSQYVMSELNDVVDQCSQALARDIVGGLPTPNAAATWSGTGLADSTVTIDFIDVSLFKQNAAYNFIDTSANLSYTVRCQSITPAAKTTGGGTVYSANMAGSVTFINDIINPSTGTVTALGSTAVATDDVFRPRGHVAGFGGSSATIPGRVMTSYEDIAGPSAPASIYEVSSAALYGWTPQNRSLGGAYSQEATIGFSKYMAKNSGRQYTHVIMGDQAVAAHVAAASLHGAAFGVSALTVSGAVTRTLDSSMDKYGNIRDGGLRFNGRPIVEEWNLPGDRIIFHNYDTTKLLRWRKFAPWTENDGNPLLLSRSRHNLQVQFGGAHELVCTQRNSVAMVYGITGL